jgi:nitrous oxidase accessory protein
MMGPRGTSWVWGAALAALLLAAPARAATLDVAAVPGALAKALDRAKAGDTLVLAPGRHLGPVTLAKPVALRGLPGAVIEGDGSGSVVHVTAHGVTLDGLTIRKSGIRVTEYDGAVFVEQGADGFVATGNNLEDNLFGIVLHGANGARIRDNAIAGRTDVYETERGNAIHLWNVKDTEITSNRLRGGRDGIFVDVSHGNLIQGNDIRGVRFAVHYMNSNRGRVFDNVSVGNKLGFALMYSNNLDIRRNLSVADDDHGLMLHSAHYGKLVGNVVRDGRGEKCFFVYASTGAEIRDNRIEGCQLGLHFTGGSEKGTISGNAFVNNRTQVKYTGMITYEWSDGTRGNYWSDNAAFDLDGDGMADTAYRPNSIMDRLVWRYPLSKLLLSSPLMEALRVAQSQFPALMPGGVIDSHPLMAPPPNPLAEKAGT